MEKKDILKAIEVAKQERLRILKGKHASPTDMMKLLSVYNKKIERLELDLKKISQ